MVVSLAEYNQFLVLPRSIHGIGATHSIGKAIWRLTAAFAAVSDYMNVKVQMANAAGYLSLQRHQSNTLGNR